MAIEIVEYREEMTPDVIRFNERLRSGGALVQFPKSHVSAWLPCIDGRRLFQQYYVARDDGLAVRGAYILKHQDFHIRGSVHSIGDFQLPISEGIVDRAYAQVGVALLRDALRRQPLLYGLGMGGYEERVARLFLAAGWSLFSVPFFFRVVRPFSFLRNVAYLRRSTARRCMLDALALTGLGWLGIHAVQTAYGRNVRPDPAIAVERVDEFSSWTDELWDRCRNEYGMSAVRNAETLRILYPKNDARFIRLKLSEQSRVVGWAVLLDMRLSQHKYFGNMRLGSIVDGFSSVADAAKVVRVATVFLRSQPVDLIVSNQAHAAWREGLRRAGFLRGPSNFIFGSSPKLTALLRQEGVQNEDLHLNRGDGDGPTF